MKICKTDINNLQKIFIVGLYLILVFFLFPGDSFDVISCRSDKQPTRGVWKQYILICSCSCWGQTGTYSKLLWILKQLLLLHKKLILIRKHYISRFRNHPPYVCVYGYKTLIYYFDLQVLDLCLPFRGQKFEHPLRKISVIRLTYKISLSLQRIQNDCSRGPQNVEISTRTNFSMFACSIDFSVFFIQNNPSS